MQPPTPFANLPNLFAGDLLHVSLCFGRCISCQKFSTLPVSASNTASALWTSFSIFSMRFDRRCLLHLGRSFALVASVVSLRMLAVFDFVLLAGGPSLVNLLSHVVG